MQALSAGRHEITLTIDEPSVINGCVNELRSAFSNLAGNGSLHPGGGRIDLIWRVNQGSVNSLWPIRESVLQHNIYRVSRNAFIEVDRGRSRETGGTGLGLAIVKHVLTRHQALLEIESELGKGSRFIARFPARCFTG